MAILSGRRRPMARNAGRASLGVSGQDGAMPARRTVPPLLVRWAFRWRLPVPSQWKPWAQAEIERKWGPEPSDADRDIEVPPLGFPLPSASLVPGRIFRRPLSIRKADDQYAVGLREDGSPVQRGTPLVEPIALFEKLPERLWPWLPVILTVAVVAIVAVTLIAALSLL